METSTRILASLIFVIRVCSASIRYTFYCREFAGGMGNSGKISFRVNSLATVHNCLVIFVSCIDSMVESYLTTRGIHWEQSHFGMKLFFVWCSDGSSKIQPYPERAALVWEQSWALCPSQGTLIAVQGIPHITALGHVLDHGSLPEPGVLGWSFHVCGREKLNPCGLNQIRIKSAH